MKAMFDRSIFDEPASVEASAPNTRFKIAPTIVIDVIVSAAYMAAAAPSFAQAAARGQNVFFGPACALMAALIACYASKPVVMTGLTRRGGDARAYVKSATLVTDGAYSWSRHPAYALTLLQYLVWSQLLLLIQAFASWDATLLVAAFGLPTAFYFLNDRIVMPVEEEMLRRLHPQEFDAYARRVKRWFGRIASP